MHTEIENLINMALADGEVTEKERAIILRKAESLGIDKDEIEMILDGKIALMNKTQKNNPLQQSKTNKAGDVKKCPSCGASFDSFSTKCRYCNYEFTNLENSISITKFLKELKDVESKVLIKQNLYERFIDPMGVHAAVKRDVEISKLKADIILSFAVPNTKEDLLEFLSVALSQISPNQGSSSIVNSILNFTTNPWGDKNKILNESWKRKCKELIIKARFAMKDDKKVLEEVEMYANLLKIN